MVNQELVTYLAEGKRRGFSIQLLKQKLLEAGFHQKDVDEATDFLERTGKSAPIQPKPLKLEHTEPDEEERIVKLSPIKAETDKRIGGPVKVGLFSKIGKAITRPSELFHRTKDEGFAPALLYQLIISIVPFVIAVLLLIFFGTFVNALSESIFGEVSTDPAGQTFLESLFFGPLVTVLIALVVMFFTVIPLLTFIGAGILHLLIRVYGGVGTYVNTYATLIYSSTPSMLFVFIPGIQIWSFILEIFGFSITHDISKLRAFFSLITIPLIFAVIWLAVSLAMLFVGGS